MSSTKSTTHRLALFAGASLVTASLAAAASLGVALTPGAAYAYDECLPTAASGTLTDGVGGTSDPSLNAALADSFTCADANYASGITYTSAGNLTVLTSTTATMTTNAGGIDLIGVGADTVTFTAGRTITGTAGAVIDVTSVSGAINITTTGVTANTGTASHAIRAVSTGGGAVSVTTGTGSVNANATAITTGLAAIEARSTGGNGAVTVTTGTGSITGRLRGIYAEASGTGALTVNVNGSVAVNATTANGGIGQIAAIDAISGTGLMTINVNSSFSATAGSAIRTDADGDVVLNIGASRTVSAGFGGAFTGGPPLTSWIVDLAAGAGRSITLTNNGVIVSTGNDSNESSWRDLALRATGGSVLIENRGNIRGVVDFSGVTGGVVFNNGGGTINSSNGWRTTEASVFSPGADTLNVASGYSIYVSGIELNRAPETTSWDFGAGADTVNLAGGSALFINAYAFNSFGDSGSGTLTITNLEAFNNAGTIWLGNLNSKSDDTPDDRLSMTGGTFTGSGASRIAMDVDFQGEGQDSCAAVVVADCVNFPGVTTAGSTRLTIQDASTTAAFGGYLGDGIVLIDVSGGTSAAGHFTLDPNSDHYLTTGPHAGMMEKGYFLFALAFDPDTVQHKLISLPNTQLTEFTALPQAVQSVWHTSTGLGFERQAQLRGADAGPGVWVRAAGEASDRDFVQTVTLLGNTVSFDNGYQQQTNSLSGGVDLVGEVWGGEYSVGAMLGYVRSDLKFDGSATNATWEGATLGLYGGYGNGPFHIDTVVNGLALATDLEDPAVSLPTGLINREMVRAVGVQAEAGWRVDLGKAFVEPLVAASMVSARFDQLVLEEAKLDYDDPKSMRAGAGVRLGGEAPLQYLTLRFDLTGRVWKEFDGENRMIVDNDGADLPLTDDFSGTFGELSGEASIAYPGGLGLFLSAGGKFQDGYQAVTGAVGATFRW